MGRTKGQVVNLKAALLSRDELRHLLRFGKKGRKNPLLTHRESLEELRRYARRLDRDGNWEEATIIWETYREVNELAEGLADVLHGRIHENERAIEGLTEEIREIELKRNIGPIEERSSAERKERCQAEIEEAERQNRDLEAYRVAIVRLIDSAFEETPPKVADPRFEEAERYFDLERELGRIPLRKEIEEYFQKSPLKGKSAQASLKAISRLKLPVGDSRIRERLDNNLTHQKDKSGEGFGFRDHVRSIREAIEDLAGKTPETVRLKRTLRKAAFDRLLELCVDERIVVLVMARVEEPRRIKGKPNDRDGVPAAKFRETKLLGGSKQVYDLFVALQALSISWIRCSPGAYDTSWINFGGESDYEMALDRVLLREVRSGPESRTVAEWFVNVADRKRPFPSIEAELYRSLLEKEGPFLALFKRANLESGIRILNRGLRRLDDLRAATCEDLASKDRVWEKAIEFLEPFDWILKGLEYGFEPPDVKSAPTA